MTGESIADLATAARPSGGRKFGISDGMILMVGVALALSASMHPMVLMADMLGRLFREAPAHAGDLPTRPHTFWESIRESFRNTIWYGYQAVDGAGSASCSPGSSSA